MKKAWFTIEQLHPQIFALAEFSHWEAVVSYLIIDQQRAFLIDTGMGYQSIKKAVRTLTSLPITVLLTHAHWDHIGGVSEFDDVRVYDDSFEKSALEKGFSSITVPELHKPSFFLDDFLPKEYKVRANKTHSTFQDGETLQSDSFDIQVIHTPGHTPGSVCFLIPQLHALFTGDTVYPGPLYAQLPESSISQYQQSIEKLRLYTSQAAHLYPGHNAMVANPDLIDKASTLFLSITQAQLSLLPAELKGKLLSIKLKE